MKKTKLSSNEPRHPEPTSKARHPELDSGSQPKHKTNNIFGKTFGVSTLGIFALVIVSLATLTLSACANRTASPTSPSSEPTVVDTQPLNPSTAQPTTIELTAVQDGQTALALLATAAEVQTKDFEFGMFIEGINGLLGNKDNYWAFYVNGEYAKEGADATILKTGDVVKFVYEPVSTSPMVNDSPVPGADITL